MNTAVLNYYFEKSGLSKEFMEQKVSKRFGQFLTGERTPSFNQLSEMAKHFRIPLGMLLSDEVIPEKKIEIPFRTVNSEFIGEPSRELRDTIDEMKSKQAFLKEERLPELDFIGRFSMDYDAMIVSEAVREILGLSKNYFEKVKKEEVFKFLRGKISRVGVFVFTNGKFQDNTHRVLDPKEFRGFVLSDKEAPIIFINQADTKNAQVFTLVHEFVHLLLGEEEILGQTPLESEYDEVEAFVNRVTAEVLVPVQLLKMRYKEYPSIDELATFFKVSRFVIARRLFDLGFLSKSDYQQHVRESEIAWKNRTKDKSTKGGNYNNNTLYRIDRNFFQYIENAIQSDRITYTEAFRLLGVGYKGYQILRER
ncbi:ImmA/IrrE family metallo-endopeptidase [uncultured Granulicatella sp.]|uniref:ImmA/IrrE family metallo-endopeptidase n=1 Tax=uncultured Granulicatella sp. TaxID=316089 RepID=UPI00261417F7|nr:ImmA/IrrE family metallo-endopeptidase [uncultured Granulicatella sp.]